MNPDFGDFQSSRTKTRLKLVQEYQNKVMKLWKFVSEKTIEVDYRWKALKRNYDWELGKIRERSSQPRVGDIKYFENCAAIEELERIKSKVREEEQKAEMIESVVSEVNRELLKAYSQLQEQKTKAVEISLKKKGVVRKLEEIRKEIERVDGEKKAIERNIGNNCIKRNKLIELKSKVEAQMLRINKEGEVYEEIITKVADCRFELNNLQEVSGSAVEGVKSRITSIEALINSIKTQEYSITLKKCELRNGSTNIFNKSTEIFDLIKAINGKILEMESESAKCLQRQQILQEKISEVSEYRKKQERLIYLKEKLSIIKNSK